jgi:hypothetical protein
MQTRDLAIHDRQALIAVVAVRSGDRTGWLGLVVARRRRDQSTGDARARVR